MKKNVYKNDRSENIKMFSDIQSPKGYSTYATNLDKIFGGKSYDNFYKGLVNPKQFKENTFIKLFEKDNSSKKLKKNEEMFNIKQFKESLNNMKLKEEERNKKLKNPFMEKSKTLNNFSIKRKFDKEKKLNTNRPYFPQVPEVGHYNPSYNVVNKHIYQVTFSNIELKSYFDKNQDENYNKTERNNTQISLKKNIKHNLTHKINNDSQNSNTITINNSSIKNLKNSGKKSFSRCGIIKNLKYASKIENKSNFTKTYNENENHCLKFEVYTSRKPLSKGILYNTGFDFKIPNYYSEKYIHGDVDFNKVSLNIRNRSYFDQFSKKQNSPPLGHYNPKFCSVLHKIRDIYLSKKEIENPKKRKLNKIIYNYKVNSNYEAVPSLNSCSHIDTSNQPIKI